MKRQNFYANFPSKLHKEKFKSRRDRNLHLLAASIIASWVHTETGRFYLSVRKLAEEIECSIKKAKEIIDNFIKWGYLRKVSEATNQYGQSVYELSTYNWDLETAKETALETASETAHNKENQALEQNSETATETALETAKETQINNELTNNEKTNNEIKANNEEKLECVNEDFEIEKEGEIQQLYTELAQEDIAPTEQELDGELNKLIGIYPKKTANFRRLRERFWNLRLKHNLFFEQIQEAVENYVLEMKSQEFDEKYLKNLDTLLDYVELEPFLFKPVLAIDKKGKRFRGEFCIATGCLRYRVNESRIESQYIDSKKFERMLDEERLIFLDDSKKLDKGELVNAA